MSQRSTRKPVSEPRRPSRGRTNLSRLRRVSDAEVRRTSPAELTNLPADFEWFRRSGPRYQTRMNAVLRMYVRRMRKHD